MTYKCPKCGNAIEEGINPCPNCGQQFNWPEKLPPKLELDMHMTQAEDPDSTLNSQAETDSKKKVHKKKKPSILRILLIIVVLSLLAAMIVPSILNSIEENEETSVISEENYPDILEKSSSIYGLEFDCTLDQFMANYNFLISQEDEISQAFNSKISKENSFSGQQTFDGISATIYSWSIYGALGNGTKVNNGAFTVAVDNSTNKIVQVNYFISTEWLNSTNESAYEKYTVKMPNIVFSAVGVDNAVEKYFISDGHYSNGLFYGTYDTYVSNLPAIQYLLIPVTKEYYETSNSVQFDKSDVTKATTNSTTKSTKYADLISHTPGYCDICGAYTPSDNLKVDAKYGKYNGVDYTGCYVCGNCYNKLIQNYGYSLAAGY